MTVLSLSSSPIEDKAGDDEHRRHRQRLRERFPESVDAPFVIVESPNSATVEAFVRVCGPDLVIARCKTLLREEIFSIPPLGQLGNAPRRFFYGPGIFNTDLTLLKRVALTRAHALQFRLEMFNVFNTPQFDGAGAVDGNIASATFGQIVRAAAPRLIQLAVKYQF